MNSVNRQIYRERDRHKSVPIGSWRRIEIDSAWRHQDPHPLEHRKLKGEDVCQELRDAVTESRWILELPDDWDNEGACSYREETWVRAQEFLFRLAVESEKTFNFLIPLPRILPGPDGSIDLHWKTDNYELLVNIPADGDQTAGFYGDDYGKMNIKGTFDPTKDTHSVLSWIKDR